MNKKIIGKCEIYHCDCMKLMKKYPDKYFDLAITDPPYGGAVEKKVFRTGGTWAAKYGNNINKWDVAPPEEYFIELFRVSKNAIICGGNYFNLPISRNFIIWKKHIPENFTMAMCEYLWTNIDGNAKIFECSSVDKDRFHPCQKPVKLYKKLLLNYAKTRIQRWCCAELKEYGGKNRYCITGVRWQESIKRKNNRGLHEASREIILNNDNDMVRRLNESCILKQKYILNPIIDWKETDVWDFIKEKKLPYNPLYDIGYKRVGCIGCPNASREELEKYPKYKEAYYRAARRHIEHREEAGLSRDKYFINADEYFNWWRQL